MLTGWLSILTALLLIVIAVVLVLINTGSIPPDVAVWYPLILLIPAALIFFVAVIRRAGRALLASATIVGIAVSLLLATQGVAPVESTLAGVVFITVGAAILLRGLLLRNQPVTS
jgi:hypothetical protein